MSSASALRWLVAVAGISGLLLATHFLGRRFSSDDSHVATVLEVYRKKDLFDDRLLDDPSNLLVWPKHEIKLPDNITVGEVRDTVRSAMKEAGGVLEGNLTLRSSVSMIASKMLQGTKFGGRFTINETPRPDHVNIYFLTSDPLGLAPHFKGNCSYIGKGNVIICDSTFIRKMLKAGDSIEYLYDLFLLRVHMGEPSDQIMFAGDKLPVAQKYMKSTLLTWVIGHELGHAVLHRSKVESNSSLHFDFKYSVEEREADHFAATRISRDEVLGTRFAALMGEFIQQQLRSDSRIERAKPDGNDVDVLPPGPVTVHATKYDVPLMVRALRMMESIYSTAPEIVSGATYGMIESDPVLVHPIGTGLTYRKFAEKVHVKQSLGDVLDPTIVLIPCGLVAVLIISFLAFQSRRRSL